MPFGDAALDHFMFIERPEGIRHRRRRRLRPRERITAGSRARTCLRPSPQDYATPGPPVPRRAARALTLLVGAGSAKTACSSATARRRSVPEEFGLPGLFRIDRPRLGAARHRGDRRCRAKARRRTATTRTSPASARSGKELAALARGAARLRARAAGRSATRCSATSASRTTARAIVDPLAAQGGRSRQLDLRTDGARAVAGLRARAVARASCAARWPTTTTTLMSVDGPRRRGRDPAARRSRRDSADDRRRRTSSCPGPRGSSCSSAPRASSASGRRSWPARRAGSGRTTCRWPASPDDLDALARALRATAPDASRRRSRRGGRPRRRPESCRGRRAFRCAGRPNCRRRRRTTRTCRKSSARRRDRPCVSRDAAAFTRGTACWRRRRSFLGNSTPGETWIHPEATTVEHCVHVAHNCPSGAITYERRDGGPQETAPSGQRRPGARERTSYAMHAAIELPDGAEFRATLVPLRPVEAQAVLRRQEPHRRPDSPPPASRRTRPVRSRSAERGGAS